MYQLTNLGNSVIRLEDGYVIPLPPSEREGFKYARWLEAGNTPLPEVQPSVAAVGASYKVRVDEEAGAITKDRIKNLDYDYTTAEADAKAYQAAGYTGTVPSGVQTWVDAQDVRGTPFTAQEAADDILTTAAGWRAAVNSIRGQRLLAKARIDAATTYQEVYDAFSLWSAFVTAIRAQLQL